MFASELKALVAAVGHELRIEPRRLVASMLYYWVPDQRVRHRGRAEAPAGLLGRVRPDGTLDRAAVLAHRGGRRARPPAGPPPTSARSSRSRSRRTWSPTCPVSSFLSGGWTRASSPCWPTRPAGDRRLHDHVPARGPAARGDARRRGLRPQGRRAVRHRPARDRDLARHRRPAAADGRHPRRADRRPGRDQHAAHVRGGPRARRQGDAVGHGRRRAVRRLPQAPGLRAWPAGTAAARRRPRAGRAARRRPAAGQRRRPRPALRRGGPSAS